MSQVSFIILARNEEHQISECIESVQKFQIADEILLIDDLSTDRTAEIAEGLGAKIIQHSMNGDWGAQWNFAISQAKFEWIFFIDADERMTEKLAKHLRKIVDENDQRFAYNVTRLNYFYGQKLKHGGWFPDYALRLFPKEGVHVEGFIHQTTHHPREEKNLPLDEFMIHYSYRDWDHYFKKFESYTTMAARKMQSEGKSASLLDILIRPAWASFRMYVLRLGFLDGKIGFFLAMFHFFYTMVKYVKLMYLSEQKKDRGSI